MSATLRWALGLTLALLIVVLPFVYYRADYMHSKRLRVVDPDKFYRSGQMTVEGFTEAVERYHIRTVLNVQDEYPDPPLWHSYFDRRTTPESELCRQLGVRYVFLAPDTIRHRDVPAHRPKVIGDFLAILDDPASYPVLLHCHAGLHRTGILTAVYRMEYQGWTVDQAMGEIQANGFGRFECTSANDYIMQYVLTYRPGIRAARRTPGAGGFMKLLDRLLLRSYLKAYLICLVSLLTLYVVVDLFTNLDDFSEHHKTLADVLKHIGTYYGFKVAQIFDRLCEAIVLMGAAFTMAWVQRSNELLPLLSAGVSTRRVVRPVLFGACATLGLSVANQELIIPRIGFYLSQSRNDPWGKLEVPVHGTFEPNRIHIDGHTGLREGMVVHTFYVVIPSEIGGYPVNLTARQARYVPHDGDRRRTGGWLLTDTKPPTLDNWNNPVLEMIDPGKYFLKTEVVDFDVITRSLTWFNFASTLRLGHELDRPDTSRLAAMAVLFHMRLTRPILGMLLVVMGLSVILRDQNRNVFISAGMCLCVCAMFFVAQFVCKQLGDNDIVAPALAAWLPVLAFGPLSFAMFDAIHT